MTLERQVEKDRAFIEKERAFIARHMGSQRTAEARGRRTRLERRMKAGEFATEAPGDRTRVRLDLDGEDDALKAGQDVLTANGLAKGFGGPPLFSELGLRVTVGDRLGITGPNGTGKTTLLRILLSAMPADAGKVWIEPKAEVGYFAQETTLLNPDATILSEISSVRPELREGDARSMAAKFLFRGDEPFKRMGDLSGGEQSRVRLMKLILQAPSVLVLDEPTNHLDIPSREVLEVALCEFPGTIIAVSHDRYFLDRICTRLLMLRAGEHRFFAGNYSFYLEQLERERAAVEAANKAARAVSKSSTISTSKPTKPKSRFAKLKLAELEAFIVEREKALETMQARFADPTIYRDADAVQRLQAEFDAIKTELQEAETEWYARSEKP